MNQLSEKRTRAGKEGRGEGVFSRKDSEKWHTIEARMLVIVTRENGLRMAGGGFDVMHDYRHMMHRTLKAIKF